MYQNLKYWLKNSKITVLSGKLYLGLDALFGFYPTGCHETISIKEGQWKDFKDIFRI